MNNEKQPEANTIKIEFFHLKTGKPNEFVDKLEELCKKYAHQRDFFFKYSVEG